MSGPPSPQISGTTSDLVYITYNNRQVVLGWSPSLEEAKATACEDLGLVDQGYTTKDIAFLFHPGNDPSQPLIEVLPSAWPKLHPLPHFQLLVRSNDEGHQAHAAAMQSHPASRQHTNSTGSSQNHQAVPQQVTRTLRTQPSTLTTSGRSQKSRESDAIATASTTEGSHASLRVDIESWRRNQVGHPYQSSNLVSQQQPYIPLPQHVLPSPPMSDIQSHRASSSQYDHSTPSSPLSQHSQTMDVDNHVRFEDVTTSSHSDQSNGGLPPQPPSASAGFLAQTGRRTTVHFPHGHPSFGTKHEIIAPTPIRRSHSQDMLNADYTNFRMSTDRHMQPPSAAAPRSAQMAKHIPAPQQQPSAISPKLQHQQEPGVPTRASKNTPWNRVGAASPQSAHPSAKHSSKPSGLRQAWDSRASAAPASAQNSSQSDYSMKKAPDLGQNRRHLSMQRSSSHSQLASGLRASLPDLGGSMLIYHQFTAPGREFSIPPDPQASRRASLPDSLYPAHLHASTRSSFTSTNTAPPHKIASSQKKKTDGLVSKAPAPVIDVDMEDDDPSSDESWRRKSQLPSTPKRTARERTLRRLKSSPSGLADQYKARSTIQGIATPFDVSALSPDAPTQFVSSTKRGPTSWPNSPVKRNASLFTQSSLSTGATERASATLPTFHLPMPNFGSPPLDRTKEDLSPLPPPPCISGSEAERAASTRALLASPMPPFVLDKKRPDSPMPPINRSLPATPQVLSMASGPTGATSAPIQRLSPFTIQDNTSYMPYQMHSPPTQGYPQQRPRNRASQSAEDLFALASGNNNSTMLSYPPLPKTRSQVNLTNSTKSRRSKIQ